MQYFNAYNSIFSYQVQSKCIKNTISLLNYNSSTVVVLKNVLKTQANASFVPSREAEQSSHTKENTKKYC